MPHAPSRPARRHDPATCRPATSSTGSRRRSPTGRVAGAPHTIAEIVAHMAFWQTWFAGRCDGSGRPDAIIGGGRLGRARAGSLGRGAGGFPRGSRPPGRARRRERPGAPHRSGDRVPAARASTPSAMCSSTCRAQRPSPRPGRAAAPAPRRVAAARRQLDLVGRSARSPSHSHPRAPGPHRRDDKMGRSDGARAPRYVFGDVELDAGRVLVLKGDAPVTARAEGVRRPAAARRARAARRRQGRDLRGRLEGHRRHRQRADAHRRAAAQGAWATTPRLRATSRRCRRAAIACCRRFADRERRRAGPRSRRLRSRRLPIGGVHDGARSAPPLAAGRGHGGHRDSGRPAIVGSSSASGWPVRGFPLGAPLPRHHAGRDRLGDLDLATAASLSPEQMTVATGYDGYLAFSPDGDDDRLQLRPIGRARDLRRGRSPKGLVATSLTRGAGQCIQPAWSPDGRFIAYAELAGGGIWIVPSRGGAARKVAEFGAHPSWSPDGRRIAFQSRPPADLNPGGSFGADSTIWVVDGDGRTPPTAADDAGPAARVARHAAMVAGQRAHRVCRGGAGRRVHGRRAVDRRRGRRRGAAPQRGSPPVV